MWPIPVIGVTQHFAPPRITAWGGVCSWVCVDGGTGIRRGHDMGAEKYEGSGAQVGRKHALFEARGI